MRLADLIDTYVAFRRSMGMRCRTDAQLLKSFCRATGDIDIAEVRPETVSAFIAGTGPVTATWKQRHSILSSFYRFAVSRGFTASAPLPSVKPKFPPPPKPHIYSSEELRRLLAATDALQSPSSPLQPLTFRTLLLMLYGTGMRIGEALSLRLQDVDSVERLVTIHDTKFFKTRVVPTGERLSHALVTYAAKRRQLPLPAKEASAFFATRTGNALSYIHVNRVFQRLRRLADIRSESDERHQPRLHDLRHAAAVHRLVAWYRAGANVQRLLPQLSTYLGHIEISSTQRYLTMTPELLREASQRFEQYAHPEVRHD